MIRHKDFFIILIRLFLGYIFLSAGLCKLTHGHFGQLIGPPLLEDTLAKYGLGLFARVVATSQVICGILLLSQRFSTLGAVMLLPMNISIIAVTISLDWHGTPYVNGLFILLNILLLVYDLHKLKVLLLSSQITTVRLTLLDKYSQNVFNLVGIAFAVLALIASRFSVASTSAFAIAAFGAIGYSIIQSRAINKIQGVIVAMVMLNMVFITVAGKLLPFAQQLVIINSLVIIILLGLSFFKFFRLNTPLTLPN